MYGNTPFRDESAGEELTAAQREHLRRELSSVAARTRELLPGEFVVGSELTEDAGGARATVAVQPPVGAAVTANYALDGDFDIDDDEREDIAIGLAASAALQVKEVMGDDPTQTAK
jgi:hypothetical protein